MNWLIVVLMIATTVLMVRPVAARAQGPVDFLKVTFIGRSQARGSILTIATVVALQFALAVPANASPGDLDPAFGGDGKVTTNFTKGFDSASDLAIQGDGKIVAVGSGGSRFALARYKHNASLDSIFGGDGKVTTKFNRGRSVAYGVVIQGNGKIIAVGSARDGGRFALARYKLNGSLDSTFGGDGRVTTKFGERSAASDVAIQEDGKIVAAGSAKNGGKFALVRYNRNGSLDPTFGGDGRVTTTIGSGVASDVAIQEDGKIVAAGESGSDKFALARYNADGTLDATFGGNGKVTTSFSSFIGGGASSVAIQGDGKIVAAGATGDGNFALARYNTDGSLDASFDGDGKVTTSFTALDDGANGVAIQGNGKIVAAGHARDRAKFALARYNTDGSLDATFGGDGKVTTNFTALDDAASGVAIQGNGKIVAAGVAAATFGVSFGRFAQGNGRIAAAGGTGGSFAMARYIGV